VTGLLHELIAEHVRPGGDCGVDAPATVGCLVAGMAAGAGSVDDTGCWPGCRSP
jgi:hypothetical protein